MSNRLLNGARMTRGFEAVFFVICAICATAFGFLVVTYFRQIWGAG
jgi:hypothetical protein